MVCLPGRLICSALLIGGTARAAATAFLCTRGRISKARDRLPKPALEARGRAGGLKADERPRSNNLERQRRREERSDEAISK